MMSSKHKQIIKGVQLLGLMLLFAFTGCGQTARKKINTTETVTMSEKYNPLTAEEAHVILHKGTERPFTGDLLDVNEAGTYVCKQCDAPLYRSDDKFDAHCGWPSFDDEIEDAVKRLPDADGMRTEIICANCGGHLGHVFLGEGFTEKNTRHCVNSISMKFVPAAQQKKQAGVAYFASGCFWGTEYHFMKAEGVLSTAVGYMGGHTENPDYRSVCTGRTGHVEVTEVRYDPDKTDYETLVKLYFETHNFEQVGGQGPDIGDQYRSVVFYRDADQLSVMQKYLQILKEMGYRPATELEPANNHIFWKAEDYHQQYYDKQAGTPYCHIYRKVF